MWWKLYRAWHLRDIRKRIKRYGWTAIYVGDYSTAPTWSYSVGFQRSLAGPEVILFDVPQASANDVFHQIHRELEAGKLVLRDGERWVDGSPMVWRKVHPSRFVDDPEQPWLALAFDMHLVEQGAPPFEAYQLVLGDPEGRMPWEAGYDEALRSRQRALWEPAELAPDPSV